jgi:hypothetical protein
MEARIAHGKYLKARRVAAASLPLLDFDLLLDLP